MLNITTCPTSDLDRLCRAFANPQTLEESAILKGAKCELADRKAATKRPYGCSLHAAENAIDRDVALLRA